jgi:hypothetical protein
MLEECLQGKRRMQRCFARNVPLARGIFAIANDECSKAAKKQKPNFNLAKKRLFDRLRVTGDFCWMLEDGCWRLEA